MSNQQNHRQLVRTEKATTAEVIKQLKQFDGSSGQFLMNLLAVQCLLSRAESGAILANNKEKGVDVLAIYPALREKQNVPLWLNKCAELVSQAASTDAVMVRALNVPEENDNQKIQSYAVLIPLKMSDIGLGLCRRRINADRSTRHEIRREVFRDMDQAKRRLSGSFANRTARN